jgi:hypothetical protein
MGCIGWGTLDFVEFVFFDAAGFFNATWRVWAPTQTPFFLRNVGTVTALVVGGRGSHGWRVVPRSWYKRGLETERRQVSQREGNWHRPLSADYSWEFERDRKWGGLSVVVFNPGG